MALTGTFDDLSFAELLQLLNLGRKTGMLIVRQGKQEAVVHIRDGEVVDAVADMIEGQDVIYRLLGWKEGEFEFTRTVKPVKRSIRLTTETLILEGMKRLDEWQQIEREFSDLNVVLRLRADAASERYSELEEDEKLLLRLVDARRDLGTIVRESGLEPARALLLLTELLSRGLVEKWEGEQATSDQEVIHADVSAKPKGEIHIEGYYSGGSSSRAKARE